jgi:hypothetical protein
MASLDKTIEIIFAGKSDPSLGLTTSSLAKNFNSLDEQVGKMTQPLANVADKVLELDAVLVALAIGGLAYAVKAAADFNGKFGEITTLISDTGAPIEKFKMDIKNYAGDSVKSIDDINQAIYTTISAGVSYKDSIKFVNEAEPKVQNILLEYKFCRVGGGRFFSRTPANSFLFRPSAAR